MIETDLQFFARRRIQELKAAIVSSGREAAASHRMLADLYLVEMRQRHRAIDPAGGAPVPVSRPGY